MWTTTSYAKSQETENFKLKSNIDEEYHSNTEDKDNQKNPLNDLNLYKILNHYKLASTSNSNNITNEIHEDKNKQNMANQNEITKDQPLRKVNDIETKISAIKEILLNSNNDPKTTYANKNKDKFLEVNTVDRFAKEEDINKSFQTSNNIQEQYNVTSGFQTLHRSVNIEKVSNNGLSMKPRLNKAGSIEVDTPHGIAEDLVDQFSEFFDKYESSQKNSDSGISEDLMFDYEDFKSLPKLVENMTLYDEAGHTNCDVFDVFENDHITMITDKACDELNANENVCANNDSKDITFTSSDNTVFKSMEKEVIDRVDDEVIIKVAKDLSKVNDFPKILIPKLNKSKSVDRESPKNPYVNPETINVKHYKDRIETTKLDTKDLKRPYTILIGSDGEETIIYTDDIDDTMDTINEHIDDYSEEENIHEVYYDPLENLDYYSQRIVSHDDICKESVKFSSKQNINANFNKLLRQTVDNNASCSTDRNVTIDKLFETNNVYANSNNNKHIASDKPKGTIDGIDIKEPKNLEELVLKCTETVLNVLQKQSNLLKSSTETNIHPIHKQESEDYFIDNSKSSKIHNNKINLLNSDIKDTKIKEAITISNISKTVNNFKKDYKSLNPDKESETNFNLLTIKRDKKFFTKNRLVKSDAEKRNFTKGPTFYEKSKILPQIMQRLTERNREYDKEKNCKRRLVLDNGTIDYKTIVKEDNKHINFIEKNIDASNNNSTHFKKNIYKTFDTGITNVNLSTKLDSLLLTTVNNKPNPSINKTDQNEINSNIKKKVDTNNGFDKNIDKCVEGNVSTDVKLNPEVLLENCNRERYLEWKRRKWLREFVE